MRTRSLHSASLDVRVIFRIGHKIGEDFLLRKSAEPVVGLSGFKAARGGRRPK